MENIIKPRHLLPAVLLTIVYLSVITQAQVKTMKSFQITKPSSRVEINSPHLHNTNHRIAKRAAGWPTETQKRKYAAEHNDFRKVEGASNMRHMEWSNQLFDLAAAWANQCQWRHGQDSSLSSPYPELGQNLYWTSDASLTQEEVVTAGLAAWMAEKTNFTFSTQLCVVGQPCGHYTQVVWAESDIVGCAVNVCPASSSIPGNFLVCNYGPAGNQFQESGRVQPMYEVGSDCTRCSSGEFWCDDGLCRSKASCYSDSSCATSSLTCAADCKNCATTNSADCSCACVRGWTGVDCSETCEDKEELCGANPGWPLSWCNDPEYPYVSENCLEMCGLCTPLQPGESPVTCSPSTSTTTTTTTTTTTPAPTPAPTTTTTTTPAPTPASTTTTPAPTPAPTATTTTTPAPTPAPTTTTTPAPTTTPVPTQAPVDCTGVCRNGGTSRVVSGQCRCTCTSTWQGDNCEENKEEAQVSMRISIYASLQVWNSIWTPWLRPLLVDAVNMWCNYNVRSCCPNSLISRTDSFLSFTTSAGLVIGSGYPSQYQHTSSSRIVTSAIFYVFGAPENALCLSASGAARRRRDLPDQTLPVEVLEAIIESVSANITETVQTCCSVEVAGVGRAVPETVTTTTTEGPDDLGPLGLEMWYWMIIGIVAGALFLVIVSISICCCCIIQRNEKRKQHGSLSASKTGFDNVGYK